MNRLPALRQELTEGELLEELLTLARQKPRYGYRRLWVVLGRRGKTLVGTYRQEHLTVRRLNRKPGNGRRPSTRFSKAPKVPAV